MARLQVNHVVRDAHAPSVAGSSQESYLQRGIAAAPYEHGITAITEAPRVSRIKLIAAFAAVYLIWGSTYLFIHFALAEMRPLLLAATRFLIAGIMLYTWVRVRSGGPGPNAREWRAGFITGGLFFVLGNGAVVWSQQRVPSGIAALLVAIVPLWVVLLDWAWPPHNRPRPVVLLGVVVGLLGLMLLVGLDVLRGGGHVDPLAALVLAAGSFSWACGTLYSPRAGLHRSGAMATATQLLGGGTLLLIAGTLFREHTRIDWGNISALTIVSLAYLVTFGSLMGFTAYAWLVNVTSPARLATYAYVNPVVAMFLGWLFAGERLNARTLVASGVVLVGVVLITIGAGKSG